MRMITSACQESTGRRRRCASAGTGRALPLPGLRAAAGEPGNPYATAASGRHRQADIEPKPSFQVLERTFGILEVFSEARPEWSTTEIARALDLPVPTVHRILAALRRLGYVSQHEETKRFRLGLGALELGERARAVADLRPIAIGPLRQLSAATARPPC